MSVRSGLSYAAALSGPNDVNYDKQSQEELSTGFDDINLDDNEGI